MRFPFLTVLNIQAGGGRRVSSFSSPPPSSTLRLMDDAPLCGCAAFSVCGCHYVEFCRAAVVAEERCRLFLLTTRRLASALAPTAPRLPSSVLMLPVPLPWQCFLSPPLFSFLTFFFVRHLCFGWFPVLMLGLAANPFFRHSCLIALFFSYIVF